jgi:hypothetical protein
VKTLQVDWLNLNDIKQAGARSGPAGRIDRLVSGRRNQVDYEKRQRLSWDRVQRLAELLIRAIEPVARLRRTAPCRVLGSTRGQGAVFIGNATAICWFRRYIKSTIRGRP